MTIGIIRQHIDGLPGPFDGGHETGLLQCFVRFQVGGVNAGSLVGAGVGQLPALIRDEGRALKITNVECAPGGLRGLRKLPDIAIEVIGRWVWNPLQAVVNPFAVGKGNPLAKMKGRPILLQRLLCVPKIGAVMGELFPVFHADFRFRSQERSSSVFTLIYSRNIKPSIH